MWQQMKHTELYSDFLRPVNAAKCKAPSIYIEKDSISVYDLPLKIPICRAVLCKAYFRERMFTVDSVFQTRLERKCTRR